MKIGHLLQDREEASTAAPPTPTFFTNMDLIATHPSQETSPLDSRSLQLLQIHSEDFPTPESLPASSPGELCPEPSVLQLPHEGGLAELYNFFVENLLSFLPVLRTEDIGSFGDMVRDGQWLLAYSMAYVAAGFVPGCKAVRASLAPSISTYLSQCALGNDAESRWIALQSVAVLYSWTMPKIQPTFPDLVDRNLPLAHDTLRAMWDRLTSTSTTLEASEDVARLLEQYFRESDIRKHMCVRRYLCRLWMYTIIHDRTWLIDPANVFKADPGISTCKYIFRDYLTDHVVGLIVAQVELCLIRERLPDACRRIHSFHCGSTSETPELSFQQPLTMLKELDDAVDIWHREWSPRWTKSRSYEPLEVYYHFTRFCISEQATKIYQSCSLFETSLGAELSLVETSIERVCDLCSVFTNMNPMSNYGLCFVPEDVFALVIYGCDYVLTVQTALHDLKLLNTRQVVFIRAMAEVMVAVGTYDKQWTASLGETLLRRLSMRLSTEPGQIQSALRRFATSRARR
ncbi:hypothetical protein LTR06_001644 [Exophiala xenobiotica]|nr:hypothetical protein LTR06_001644 [Exophiala xenobiotica]